MISNIFEVFVSCPVFFVTSVLQFYDGLFGSFCVPCPKENSWLRDEGSCHRLERTVLSCPGRFLAQRPSREKLACIASNREIPAGCALYFCNISYSDCALPTLERECFKNCSLCSAELTLALHRRDLQTFHASCSSGVLMLQVECAL